MGIEKIKQIVEKYQRGTSAPLGVAFKDLRTGATVTCHAEEPFPTASAYKIYVLAELYRKAYSGECNLNDRYPLTVDIKSIGSGVLEQLDAGLNLTLKDYATLMMIISDNTATDFLFNFLGRDKIKKNVIDALGFSHTKCDWGCQKLIDVYYDMNGRDFQQLWEDNGKRAPSYYNSKWYQCVTEENDQTAPIEALKMLELLYRGTWVNQEASEGMLAIMKQCQTNTRIPHFLPPGVAVAHKTGSLDKLNVDIGIVYAQPVGDYILCMFYNGNLASKEDYDTNDRGRYGDNYLARLSKEMYEAYIS